MNTYLYRDLPCGSIHVENVDLWAHVGVLEHERLLGQMFRLNFVIWIDLDKSAENDNLLDTSDYSLAIKALQQLAFRFSCQTIECFSEKILECLEDLYGPVPMEILLTKCEAPVPGFSGSVAVNRKRNFPNSLNT